MLRKIIISLVLFVVCLGMNGQAVDSAPPELAIYPCGVAPVLNGVLDDACWQVSVINNFNIFLKEEKSTKTKVFLSHDNQWLYLGFECLRPDANAMKPKALEHDRAVHTDDSIEIFFDPGTKGALYYHFLLNFANIRGEKRVTKKDGQDIKWDIPWRSATMVTNKGWNAEIAIPLYIFASYGDLKNARINLCRTVTGTGVDNELSSWAPVKREFHEPDSFGVLKGLGDIKIKVPFLPAIENAAIGQYRFLEGKYSYGISVDLSGCTSQSGKIKLTGIDKPASGKGCQAVRDVELGGTEKQTVYLSIPIDSVGPRTAELLMSDPGTGEVLQSVSINEASILNVLNVYLDRSYYTSEEHATAVCTVGLPAEILAGMELRATDITGNILGQSGKIVPQTGLRIALGKLAPGAHNAIVELRAKKGETAAQAAVLLIKRESKPGFEWKTDRINRVVLRDGRPFFPAGVFMAGIRSSQEKHFQKISEAGFNSIIHGLSSYLFSDNTDAYFEMAKKYNLLVMEWPIGYAAERGPDGKLEHANITGLAAKLSWIKGFREKSEAEKEKICADAIGESLKYVYKAVEDSRKHSNLMSYYSFDEPPAYFAPFLRAFYKRVNEIDGYHPVYMMGMGINQLPKVTISDISDFCDILGTDPYIAPTINRIQGDQGTPSMVSKYTLHMRKFADPVHNPVWMVICAEEWSGIHKRFILPEEQYCQTYLALIHGAKGLFYFTYPVNSQISFDAISKMADHLKVLGPIAVTPDIPQKINYSPVAFSYEKAIYPDVQVSLRENPEGGYVLLAANSRDYPVDATYKLSCLGKQGTVKRLFSKDKYPVTNGSFSERMEVYAIRAYSFKPENINPPVVIDVNVKAHPELVEREPVEISRYGREGEKNLAPNPGFEDMTFPGRPDYYYGYYHDINNFFGADTTDPYEGKTCLKLTRKAEKGIGSCCGFHFRLDPRIKNAQKCVFSVYLKASTEGMKVHLKAHSTDPAPAWEKIITPTTSWKRYYISGPIDQLGELNHFGVFSWDGPVGTIWADAVQVEAGEEPTDFEK